MRKLVLTRISFRLISFRESAKSPEGDEGDRSGVYPGAQVGFVVLRSGSRVRVRVARRAAVAQVESRGWARTTMEAVDETTTANGIIKEQAHCGRVERSTSAG